MLTHKQIMDWADDNVDRIIEAAAQYQTSLDDPGFCLACGEEAHGCEPDLTYGKCESCGARKVFGAQELVFYI